LICEGESGILENIFLEENHIPLFSEKYFLENVFFIEESETQGIFER